MAGWICRVWSISDENKSRYFVTPASDAREAMIAIHTHLKPTPDIRITAVKETMQSFTGDEPITELNASECAALGLN